jgi:hypothetical protein
MSEVKVVKLVTGEELISKVEEVDNISIILTNPCILIATQEGYGVAPWAFITKDAIKDGVEVMNDKVLYIAEPMDEFKDQYNQAFSPIAAPSNKIVTPGDLKISK